MDRCRAGETWPPDLAEFVALISESGANPFGLTVDAVMEEYRRWRDESWRYDGSDKYPWPQPVLYHICLEMRTRGIERQMTQGELKRLAERQLTKWVTEERPVKSEAQDMLTGEVEQKVTADMMIEFIGQDGAKTCEELAGKFGVSTRKVASTLAVVTATGRLARVNQNDKFRYCMPGDNLPAEPKAALVTESDGKAFPQPAGAALPVREAATQEEIKTETVADIVQPLPSFTETQADELIFPSLRRANLALRRAKSDVQKWERVCAALREVNKHRDIVRQITDSSRRVVSEK